VSDENPVAVGGRWAEAAVMTRPRTIVAAVVLEMLETGREMGSVDPGLRR